MSRPWDAVEVVLLVMLLAVVMVMVLAMVEVMAALRCAVAWGHLSPAVLA